MSIHQDMNRTLRYGLAFLFFLLGAFPAGASPRTTQNITLTPGWNAVYLEVDPEVRDIATVFLGLPLISLWHWQQDMGRVEFIADPSDGLLNQSDWRGFFPQVPGGTPFLTNLHALRGNQAYLVHLGGTQNVQLAVSGRPSLRPTKWLPNSFNLVGFHVDPQAPPSAANYFAPSPAHVGQPVYRLTPEGVWQLMSPGESLESGQAYWVYTQGKSSYQGPLEVLPPTIAGLELGSAIGSLDLGFRNHAGATSSVTLNLIPSNDGIGSPVLAHWQLENGEVKWPLLPSSYNLIVEGGGIRNVPIAVRRSEISGDRVAGLLEVKDNAGSRFLVPVTATAPGVTTLGRSRKGGSNDFTGLWVGSATINKVSEVRRNIKRICPCPESNICPPAVDGSIQACRDDADEPYCSTGIASECTIVEQFDDEPIPARREFELRLLVHCDESGVTRLLKEATLMFQEGAGETPGNFVVVTNDERLHEFAGTAMRGGVPVGTRVSSAAFDFPGTSLALTGAVGPDQTLSGTITLAPDFATNPFRHRYHPDHNQLDEQYLPFTGESQSQPFEEFEITRALTLLLEAADPEEHPEAGDSLLVGTYQETISGLHRQDISVEGTLRLRRLAAAGTLAE